MHRSIGDGGSVGVKFSGKLLISALDYFPADADRPRRQRHAFVSPLACPESDRDYRVRDPTVQFEGKGASLTPNAVTSPAFLPSADNPVPT